MVEINQLFPGTQVGVHQRGQQPTGAESRTLVSNEPADQLFWQVGTVAPSIDRGAEANHPFLRPEAPDPLGQSRDLIRDAQEVVGLPPHDAPDGGVGKKSRGLAQVTELRGKNGLGVVAKARFVEKS
jgi:hypothetical protein